MPPRPVAASMAVPGADAGAPGEREAARRVDGYFFPETSDGDAVATAARGLALTHPATIAVNLDPLYLRARSPHPQRRVALVSGGGAGHEPLHAGFLGRGGLDAACVGQVFTSPHNRQVYEASRAVALPGGVLHVVKNYTGDVINFAIAAERLRADGIEVARVLVDDDLATESEESGTGRRGTAATVAVEKILGAAADRGAGLAELAGLGERVVARARSVAVASRAQTSPATGAPAFDLAGGELEYGVGIHGERAAQTVERPSTAALVERMLDQLLGAVEAGPDGLLLLVNGLGAVTELELFAVRAAADDVLAARGLSLASSAVGTYTAALDMRGFSLTLVGLEAGWLDLWLAPTGTPSLPHPEPGSAAADGDRSVQPSAAAPAPAGREGQAASERSAAVLAAYADAVRAAHAELTRLDQVSGDGDFGDNLSGGLRRAVQLAEGAGAPGGLDAAATVFLDEVGGSSGPLFGLVFQALAPAAADGATPAAFATALTEALSAVQRVGGAQVGDRTLVDALAPAAAALQDAGTADGALATAALAAVTGARATADLRARRGRASYVGDRALGSPDPGAVGVALLLVELARVFDTGSARDLPSAAEVTAG